MLTKKSKAHLIFWQVVDFCQFLVKFGAATGKKIGDGLLRRLIGRGVDYSLGHLKEQLARVFEVWER